ncbi:hypothetical protein V6N12_074246 [Hibiscus sabdariffa]|uniref:Secreted protein n=1 Tax=Hibiscus sabdariffa TaxID=183260 RepID=A0ABR2BG83_9ROSI
MFPGNAMVWRILWLHWVGIMGGKVRRFRPLHGVSCIAWTMRGSRGCRLVRCSVLWTIRVDVGAGCLVCFEAG